MRKLLLAVVVSMGCSPAQALLRTWPSPTCSTTLQACIDGSVSGDELVIEVRYAQLLASEQGRLRLAIPTTIAPR